MSANDPAAAAQQAGQAAQVATPFRPTTPKFGGIVQVSATEYVAWTGGKPKADFSELENTNPSPIKPNQHRGNSIASRAKQQAYCIAGMETKFNRNGDLLTFQKKIEKHFEQYGLDTITYMVDPSDPTKVVSVLDAHSRFNKSDGVREGNNLMITHYDTYDMDNNTNAKDYLLNSISSELEKQLYQNCSKDCSFIEMWLNLVHIVKSVSINRFERIKKQINLRKISDYASENIEELVTNYYDDWEELHDAKMYDFKLNLTMLTTIMEAGNEEFRYPLRDLKLRLKKKLLNINHLTYDAAHQELVQDELDTQSILTEAKRLYREQHDDGAWPAAQHASDSKALNKNYGKVNKVEESNSLSKAVNALMQMMNGSNNNKSKNNRRDNGQKNSRGYGKAASKPNSRNKSARNNPRKHGTRNPYQQAPKEGEGEIKYFGKDGKEKRYWCAKCNRWTLSHSTSQHKTKEELQSENGDKKANMARVSFDLHPAAFMAKGPQAKEPKVNALNYWLNKFLQVLSFGSLIFQLWIFIDCAFTRSVAETGFEFLVKYSFEMMKFAHYCLITFCDISVDVGSNLLTAVIHEWQTNVSWIWLITTAMSALVGFGFGTYLYSKIPNNPTRLRYSSNIRKQVMRATKPKHRGRLSRNRRSRVTPIKPSMVDATLTHHPRFSNVPRPKRYELPSHQKIVMLKSEIKHLETEIKEVKKYLDCLYNKLSQKKQHLRDLEIPLLKKNKSLAKLHKCKPTSCANSPMWYDKCSLKKDTRPLNNNKMTSNQVKEARAVPNSKKPKYRYHNALEKQRKYKQLKITNWFSKAKCTMAKLINLSNISSTDKEAHIERVLFDSGANCCVTNRRSDFVGRFKTCNGNQLVDGIGKGLQIKGEGKVAWTFEAEDGTYRTLLLPCYYIPTCTTRIASIQVILKTYPKETVKMSRDSLTLSGHGSSPAITVTFCETSNLPFGLTATNPNPKVHKVSRSKSKTMPTGNHSSVVKSSNINLTEPEKELLRWHYRLGHVGMSKIQWLFRLGVLASSEKQRRLQASAAKLTHGPLCTACQYAKQRRKTTPGTTKTVIKQESNSLKRNELFPGSEISVDHFFCNPLGRLLHTYGKEKADAKYRGGCIFKDASSDHSHVELQTSLNSHSTLEAKRNHDKMCHGLGVVPQKFISDNGTSFLNKEFEAHLEEFHQTIRHSGVGAHHSNGIAERGIGTITSIARAMMHHAAIHWPEVADVALWPLAVLHAVYILNRIPRESTGRSPLELFSRKVYPSSKFQDFHVWGCPVYVLDHSLSDGHKVPRWKPRSSRCVYVGQSQDHGHSIPLVLNLDTGKITPQFHVVFDDYFQTVDASGTTAVDFDSDDWYATFGLSASQYVPDEDEFGTSSPDLLPPVTELEGVKRMEELRAVRDHKAHNVPLIPELDPPTQTLPQAPPTPLGQFQFDNAPSAPQQEEPPAVSKPPASLQREKEPIKTPRSTTSTGYFDVEFAPPRELSSVSTSRTSTPRKTDATDGYVQETIRSQLPSSESRRSESAPTDANIRTTRSKTGSLPTPRSTSLNPVTLSKRVVNYVSEHTGLFDQFYAPSWTPFVAKANTKDPDLYNWDQAMASEHKEEFLKAATNEIQGLVEKGTWTEVPKSEAKSSIVPNIWVFKTKRAPSGEFKKFKGRLCLRGDRQEDTGRDNFSPVAAWSTVRLFLVVALILGWITLTIDFESAFVQSKLPADEPVWMHMPRGFKSSLGNDYCLHLNKSLYGHRRAPQLWFQHSSKAFKKIGLVQSKFDPCLWFGKDIMVVQYVDDCGIAAPNMERIDQFIEDLRKQDLQLTKEESFAEFLGIDFKTHHNGCIEMTQTGLINKTLEAAGMSNCNPNAVPATQNTLGADVDGEPMNESWNYRGICGMLLYLSTNTRPDIAFAVSQVCRFGHNPKKSHAQAVKTILRYLKGTANKGIVVKPSDGSLKLDLYVDSDFCGLFGREDPRDVNSARSRTGYIVMCCGWPIIWKSQLQTHLSQSTLEAEYTALSSALRTFLPLKNLLIEILDKLNAPTLQSTMLHASVFEDNQSTYYLATNQRITARTRYLLAKWHWFWDAYNRKEFAIYKCPTEEQCADYLTKPLAKVLFQNNRERVQNW